MGSSYLTNPLIFLIQTLIGTYALLVMLRFLLQWVNADFYNPISRFIVAATAPALMPIRRVVPGLAGLDISSLVLAWLLKAFELFLVILLLGGGARLFSAMLWAIPELVEMLLNIFLVAIIIQVVFSWIGPQDGYNPIALLSYDISEPIIRPAQQFFPPFSGLDFSPMIATIALVLLKMLLLPPLKELTFSPF